VADIDRSAAELRAAAAEKRLAALNTKSEPKEEHDDEDNYDELKAEEEDVPDPHLDPATRRKQMESEMSENEMEGLRGGWADIFPSLAGSSRMAMIKRELSPNAEDASQQTKKANTAPHPRTRFGSELVREEQKRGLGLSGTSRQAKGQVLGSIQATDKGGISVGQSNEVVREDGKRGWACAVCTFANIMDHGRCGECILYFSLLAESPRRTANEVTTPSFVSNSADQQRCAGPGPTEKCLTTTDDLISRTSQGEFPL